MINKAIISTYLKLNNEKTDQYLVKLANEIKGKTLSSKINDVIYQNLELLEEFVYKAPRQAVDIFEHILKTNPPASKTKSKFGAIGKTRVDIILKGLDLLSEIRYILPNAVLPLLERVIANEENPAREKALEILKKFSKYDLNVLKSKIGYGAQRTALDYILKWSLKKCLAHIDFVLTIAKEVLTSSVQGSSWTDEKTLNVSSSHVNPTDFLKKMRRETIDFVYDLYVKTNVPKVRLRLASVLEEVMRGPTSVAYSNELAATIANDTKYLAEIYRKMIFDDSGNIIKENIAVAEEVEERLYYFAKPEREGSLDLIKLREDILKDSFYEKVSPMIGGRATYKNMKGYEESMSRRASDVQKRVNEISHENLNEWKVLLEIMASQKDVIEEWKLRDFKDFLEKLSGEKPGIVDLLLESAFKEKSALMDFSESFLIGFQNKREFSLWDKYSELILKERNISLVVGICTSLIVNEPEKPQKTLRPNEVAILEEIVFKKGRFKFLNSKERDASEGNLHYFLFVALASNFMRHRKKMEQLIREEMRSNPKYAYSYYNALQIASTVKKWMDLSLASASFRQYLLKKVIEAPELNWELQEFLIELCEKSPICIMGVFEERIDRSLYLEEKDKTRGQKRLMKSKEFEAIPYHFNSDLQKLLIESKDFPMLIRAWVGKMHLGWSSYNWEVRQFLESVGVDRRQVLSDIVERGDDDDLLRVAYAIEDVADIEFCLQIIGRSDDKRVHDKIESVLYATGVVSGEYGIAEDYEKKSEMLKQNLNDGNSRVKKFAQEMIDGLRQRAEEERKRVAEEIQLRKIRFEG